MKRIFNFFIAVVGVLFIISCSNEAEVNTSAVKPAFKPFADSLYTNYRADVFNKNEVILQELFDSVAYRSLDLVLTKRAYESKPEEAPKLKGVALSKMKSKIKGESENDNSIRNYIDEFIVLKNSFPKDGLLKKSVFVNETNAITESELYLKKIIKDKAEDSLYINLTSRIKQLIKTAQRKYETTIYKTTWLKKYDTPLQNDFKIQQEKKRKSAADSDSKLKNSNWPMLGLLAISLLSNIVLGILLFRNRRKTQKVEIQENDTLEREQKSELPNSLTQTEVNNYISKAFTKLQTDLTAKYHKDCIETQFEELKSFKSAVSEKSKSQQFKDLNGLEHYVSHLLKNYHGQIVQKLAELLDKHSAQQQLERKLDTDNFVLKYASSIISEEEIRSKVIALKKRFYDEIPKVISKSDLETDAQNLRESMVMAIEKMITENSQLYFPYADAQGILYDDKKAKEKERDSAIILTLNPKDNTRATFQLLYEYSDMMQAGIQSYDILLLPICDLKSEDFDRNGTKISQNGKDGEMIFEDGKWKLQTKLAIKITQ